jgi:hypothetical protein
MEEFLSFDLFNTYATHIISKDTEIMITSLKQCILFGRENRAVFHASRIQMILN